MVSLDTQLLKQLGERKLHLLTQLHELSIGQQVLVSEQRVEELLVLLSRKSETIADLQLIQADLEQFRDQDPDERVWASQADRELCRAQFERCEALIAELLAIENHSMDELTQRRELVAQQLQQFVTADAIQEAYHNAASESEEYSSFSLDG